MSNETLVVGEISGVSGVKGWVKIFSFTEPRLNILKYNPWLIGDGDNWKNLELISGRAQGKTIVAQLKGVDDREQAFSLIGSKIAIMTSQLQTLESEDFYWRDLEGLAVYNLAGEYLGVVSHLIETGANDVLVVDLPKEVAQGQKIKEMMIPYLMGDVIKKVDLTARRMDVDWDNEYL